MYYEQLLPCLLTYFIRPPHFFASSLAMYVRTGMGLDKLESISSDGMYIVVLYTHFGLPTLLLLLLEDYLTIITI